MQASPGPRVSGTGLGTLLPSGPTMDDSSRLAKYSRTIVGMPLWPPFSSKSSPCRAGSSPETRTKRVDVGRVAVSVRSHVETRWLTVLRICLHVPSRSKRADFTVCPLLPAEKLLHCDMSSRQHVRLASPERSEVAHAYEYKTLRDRAISRDAREKERKQAGRLSLQTDRVVPEMA